MLSANDLLGPPPSTDTVYISNVSKDITEEDLVPYFGQIGLIKKDKTTMKHKVFLYRDEDGMFFLYSRIHNTGFVNSRM